jgi:hypothetical protein
MTSTSPCNRGLALGDQNTYKSPQLLQNYSNRLFGWCTKQQVLLQGILPRVGTTNNQVKIRRNENTSSITKPVTAKFYQERDSFSNY